MKNRQRTVCDPNCHANPKCGLYATVEGETVVAVEPADYPIDGYKNRICLMGVSRLEYQNHPDRLTVPLKRVGERGEGKWKEISWEEAIDLFVEKQNEVIKKHGAKAISFTVGSGAYGLLTRGSPARYAALIGASTSRVSGFDYALPKGLETMFGLPAPSFFSRGGHAFEDAANSELVLLWGGNPVVTRSVDYSPLKVARKSGTKLICIDPTNSETAKLCDEWISLRPGSDGALALALAHQIIKDELHDLDFLTSHTDFPLLINLDNGEALKQQHVDENGGDERLAWCVKTESTVPASQAQQPAISRQGELTLTNGETVRFSTVYTLYKDMVASMPPSEAAKVTGIDEADIIKLARAYGDANPGSIRMGYGIDRYYYSDVTARAIAALACLTGNIGIPGGGITLSSGWQTVPVKGRTFYSPDGKLPNYLSLMEIDSSVRKGVPYPIKMECISLGNLFLQAKPNRASVLKNYISQLEFITVTDHFMTDTAKQADLVLPACTIFERTDLIVDKMLQLQQKVVPARGQAKSDFEIISMIAEKSGLGDYFNRGEEAYIADMLDSDHPALKDVDFEQLKSEKVIHPWAPKGQKTEPYIGFRKRTFPTSSGRIEVYKDNLIPYGSALPVYREPIEASPKNPLFSKYPLVLLSSHSRYRIHSTFANLDKTKTREPHPIVRMSPDDASVRGLSEGDVVNIYNERGLLKIKCRVDDNIRQGCVVISEGQWADDFIEGDPYILTHDAFSATSENYAHYDVLVEASAVN